MQAKLEIAVNLVRVLHSLITDRDYLKEINFFHANFFKINGMFSASDVH